LQWVAFVHGCRQEMLEVKSGHIIAIAYNLYVDEGIGNLARQLPPIDPSISLMYPGVKQMLQQMLKEPSFMKDGTFVVLCLECGICLTFVIGGVLGFFCVHEYFLGLRIKGKYEALKGLDAAFLKICQSLSLETVLRRLVQLADQDLRDIDAKIYTKYRQYYFSRFFPSKDENNEWECD